MINTCLFPIAGFGTRFLPVTKTVPKEMLPIVNKPLILYAVLEAIDAGIYNMGFITGKYKRAVEDFFDDNNDLYNHIKSSDKEQLLHEIIFAIDKANFSYTRQKKARGLGDAILCGRQLTTGDCAVILPDDLCVSEDNNSSVLKEIINIYDTHNCPVVAVMEIPSENSDKYGIIEGIPLTNDIYQITSMIEKPKITNRPTSLAVIGRYVLTSDVFDIIANTNPGKSTEIQLTDALSIKAQHSKVLAYKFKGTRFDCGALAGFISANNYFYNKK